MGFSNSTFGTADLITPSLSGCVLIDFDRDFLKSSISRSGQNIRSTWVTKYRPSSSACRIHSSYISGKSAFLFNEAYLQPKTDKYTDCLRSSSIYILYVTIIITITSTSYLSVYVLFLQKLSFVFSSVSSDLVHA